MLKRSDVPKVIYIREKEDVVRQLCSIGDKTYASSHRVPYGDAAKVKTFTDREYQEFWDQLQEENMDRTALCNIHPSELIQKQVNIQTDSSAIGAVESARFYNEKELQKAMIRPMGQPFSQEVLARHGNSSQ